MGPQSPTFRFDPIGPAKSCFDSMARDFYLQKKNISLLKKKCATPF